MIPASSEPTLDSPGEHRLRAPAAVKAQPVGFRNLREAAGELLLIPPFAVERRRAAARFQRAGRRLPDFVRRFGCDAQLDARTAQAFHRAQHLQRERVAVRSHRARPAVVAVHNLKIFAQDRRNVFALVVFDQVRIEPARIVAAVDEIDKVPAHDRLIQTARRLKRHAAKRFYELRVRSLRLQQRQRPGVICADARENLFQPGAEITFRQSGHPLGISVQPFFQHTSVVRNGVHVSRAAHNVRGL